MEETRQRPVPGLEEVAAARRFELLEPVGRGGMGQVHRVRDRRTGRVLALKTELQHRPSDLVRLKSEFRRLRDLEHPGLLRLEELFVEGEAAFFTMEYVAGRHPLQWFRDRGGDPGAVDPQGARVLGRLVAAIRALHGAGLLHRDIKDENVLIRPDGRVVLLDFGLVQPFGQAGRTDPRPGVFGTLAYMPPEQIRSASLTEAADWYAFGVLLYRLLTGVWPFPETRREAIVAKTVGTPVPAARQNPRIPSELADLVDRLLSRDPEARPAGRRVEGVFRELAGERPDGPESLNVGPVGTCFVGREYERSRLFAAHEAAVRGAPRVLCVQGPPGIGKTALVQEFIASFPPSFRRTFVRGACHPTEAVPLRALDSLIDDLRLAIEALPDEDADAIEPRHATELAHVFPVLAGLWTPDPTAEAEIARGPDRRRLRRRARSSLAELLRGLGERRELVLWIDDIHWADAESAELLAELLGANPPPRLLLLLTGRPDAATEGFFRAAAGSAEGADRLVLGPLAEPEVELLVGMEPTMAGAPAAIARGIVEAAAGSPLVALELARGVGRDPAPPADEAPLPRLVRRRLDALPGSAVDLLRDLALAGEPLAGGVLSRLADGADRSDHLIRELFRLRMCRRGDGPAQTWTVAHDGIREVVTAELDAAARRRAHRRLAGAASEETSLDFPVRHWVGAGETDRARDAAIAAADRSAASFGFEREAHYLALALGLGGESEDRRPLHRRRARALAALDRNAEAASHHLAAAEGASPAEATVDRTRASELLIASGRASEGRAVLEPALAAEGLSLPRGEAAWLGEAVLLRAGGRLAARWVGATDRDIAAVRRRADLCWTVVGTLGYHEPRAFGFQARHLALARASGDPVRLARGLGMELLYVGAPGPDSRADAVRAELEALDPATLGDSDRAFVRLSLGYLDFLSGRFPAAAEAFEDACTLYADHTARWERAFARTHRLINLYFLGRLEQLEQEVGPRRAELAAGDDRGASAVFELGVGYLVDLMRDDVGAARDRVAGAVSRLGEDRTPVIGYLGTVARAHIELYAGRPGEATRALREGRRATRRFRMFQNTRVMLRWLEGAAALQNGADPRGPRTASAAAKAIEREGDSWGRGLAWVLRAGVERKRGGDGAEELAAAGREFEARGMAGFAAAVGGGELAGVRAGERWWRMWGG